MEQPPWWKEVNDHIDAKLVHSIHTSERLGARGCRLRHHWVFDEGYYPVVTPKPLEFGVAFHSAMQAYYNPETWHDRKASAALALVTFKQVVGKQYSDFVKNSEYPLDPEARKDYAERIELGLSMLKYYTERVSPEYDKGFTPIGVEVPFEVPILDPEGNPVWCKCNTCWRRYDSWYRSELRTVPDRSTWKGLPVTYGGRADMICEDLNGEYWIFDWKTAARLSGTWGGGTQEDDDSYMLLDDQITSYCWSFWLLGKLLGGKIPVAGFVYAQIKKAVPVEPEPNTRPRLGRMYSVNKSQETDADTYRRTVEENDPGAYEAGLYDDFIDYLRQFGGHYHRRHQIRRTEIELANAGYNIWQEALDMIDPNRRIYPMTGRFSCTSCAFQSPCLSKRRGEDYLYQLDSMYIKRPYKYWEAQELSTDKTMRG